MSVDFEKVITDKAEETSTKWSIINYSIDEARQMLVRGKEYLENLLRPLNSNYRCISYRAGSWCVAPSPFMLNLLADLGKVFDISIIGKLKYDTRRIKLDYSNCVEDFVPFYPVMTDARRVSDKVERIVCIPTNHFYGARRLTLKQWASIGECQCCDHSNPAVYPYLRTKCAILNPRYYSIDG